MTNPLTDTQTIILSAAAGRDDGSIHPLPKTLKGGAVTKVTQALLRKGLIAEAPGREDWPDRRDPYFAITAEGALAINVEPARRIASNSRRSEKLLAIDATVKTAPISRLSARLACRPKSGNTSICIVTARP